MAVALNTRALHHLEHPNLKKPGGTYNDVIRCFLDTGEPNGWHTYVVLQSVLLSFLPTARDLGDFTNYIRNIVQRWNNLARENHFGVIHNVNDQFDAHDGCILTCHHRLCERPGKLRKPNCCKGRFLKEFRIDPTFLREVLATSPSNSLPHRVMQQMPRKREAVVPKKAIEPAKRRKVERGKRLKDFRDIGDNGKAKGQKDTSPLSPSPELGTELAADLDSGTLHAITPSNQISTSPHGDVHYDYNQLPSAHLDELDGFSHLAYLGLEDLPLAFEGLFDDTSNMETLPSHVQVPNDNEMSTEFQESFERFLEAAPPDVPPIESMNVDELDWDNIFRDFAPLSHSVVDHTEDYNSTLAAIESLIPTSARLTHGDEDEEGVMGTSISLLNTEAPESQESQREPEYVSEVYILHPQAEMASQDSFSPPTMEWENMEGFRLHEVEEAEEAGPSKAQQLLNSMIALLEEVT